VRLGGFELHEAVGRGAMGIVWRGEGAGLPVAVKVLTEARARDPAYIAAFTREIHAVARLRHPGVVTVYDHGVVPPDTGALVAGAPYLVMELARSSLAAGARIATWGAVRDILVDVLGALAAAHARGLVHRDLKPANVLLCGGRLKLSDFGLACPGGRRAPFALTGGSPGYMAPEQLLGAWRDFGPWTDLYATGCLAWFLCTGARPFADRATAQLAHLHLNEAVPALRPRMPVPAGFTEWVATLLQKAPTDRFGHAADATAALLALDGEPLTEVALTAPVPISATVTLADDAPDTFAMPTTPRDAPAPRPAWPAAPGHRPQPTIRLPASWRSEPPEPPPPNLGLGLYGLRETPVVGRSREQRALWQALRRVIDTRRPGMVVLRGLPGFGKSRLAEWLCHRTAELGAARWLAVRHDPLGGPEHGLRPAIAAALRCADLSRDDIERRLVHWLRRFDAVAEADAEALADFLADAWDGSTGARDALLSRLLARMSADRPLVLWLDDLQWGADAAAFVGALLADPLDLAPRVLVVATTTGAAPESSAPETSSVLDVGPLPPESWPVLVRELLGLDGELARRVCERTAGHPLFATQLVGDWVRREVLVPGGRGYRLKRGARADLPDDLHGVWSERVLEVLRGLPSTARAGLEIAAALGRSVSAREWDGACDEPPGALVDRLVGSGLADRTPEGWVFTHAVLRESVERLADEAGRAAGHHRRCAAVVDDPVRRGRHLLLAGDGAAALAPLLEGARGRVAAGDYAGAGVLLDEREAAVDASQTPGAALDGWLLYSRLRTATGQLAAAESWARRAEAVATDDPQRARARYRLGKVAQARGDFEVATARLRGARALGDKALGGHCEIDLGWVHLEQGELAAAAACFEAALPVFHDEPRTAALCLRSLGVAERRAGRLEAADAHTQRALALYGDVRARAGAADCLNSLGEIARAAGDAARAERHYRAALERQRALGSSNAVYCETNLGLVLLGRGEDAEAEVVLAAAEGRAQRTGRGGLAAAIAAHRLAARDWSAEAFEAVARRLEETGYVDPDVAWSLRRAAKRAPDVEWAQRALHEADRHEVTLT